ncbi:MAG TPA: FecR domain-containing protein, partial [Myxococcales bacterium]|nr:FecR domain-containing protein [Myxococcales bacterium]
MVRTLLMVLFAATSTLAADEGYVVQPGDTCAALSRRFFPGDPARLDQLHALNPQLGPPPHHLKPGTRLRIKPDPDATITFFKPMVQRKARAEPRWEDVSQGENLFRLDSVTTLAGAGAEVTFREQNKLRMDENALIVIYGGTPSSKDAAANRSGAIELVQGDLALRLAEMRGETMQVRTPGAVVAGNMRSGRVGVDADKMSRVSVFEGDAKVSASGKAVAVHEGFGTRVAKGKPPEPPEPLPVAPTWLSAAPGPRILVGAATAQQTLSWEEGAAAYRLQVSHDSAFNDLLLDEKPSAERTRTVALPPGRYFTRVWAINAKGMAGPPGPVWTLDVLAVKAEGATPGEGGFHAPGPVKLNIDAPPGVPVFLDGKALASGAVTVSEPGKHELTAGSAKVSVEIAPPPPPPAPPPVVVAPPPPPPRPPPALTSYVQSRVAAGPLVDPWRDTRPELELSLQSIGGD